MGPAVAVSVLSKTVKEGALMVLRELGKRLFISDAS